MTSIDVSNKLGQLMLQGWVLTDQTCRNAGCYVPLMRSPKGRIPVVMFCANCDDDKHVSQSSAKSDASVSPSVASTANSLRMESRPSTPATDVSAPDSPTFVPLNDPETMRRRQQSDEASAEIGRLLLKGWVMLADECPNPRCYGIPLMGTPRAGGIRDPRKECVACGTIYVDEKDASEIDHTLVPVEVGPPASIQVLDPNTGLNVPEIPKSQTVSSSPAAFPRISQNHRPSTKVSPSPPGYLEATASSIELSLMSMSKRLADISEQLAFVDPQAIGSIVETMGKALGVLEQVNRLKTGSGSTS